MFFCYFYTGNHSFCYSCFSDSGRTTSLSTSMPMSPADLHGMWYPTVRRTLVTLSKLYRCIDVSFGIHMINY